MCGEGDCQSLDMRDAVSVYSKVFVYVLGKNQFIVVAPPSRSEIIECARDWNQM